MKIASTYSHLNGIEYLTVHKPRLLGEVRQVIAQVDAEACKEKTMKCKLLYSSPDMNKAFKAGLEALGWTQRQNSDQELRPN